MIAVSTPGLALQEDPVPCGPTGLPVLINYGERATCAISNAGEVDIYQFIGSAGDSIRVSIAGTSTTRGPQL